MKLKFASVESRSIFFIRLALHSQLNNKNSIKIMTLLTLFGFNLHFSKFLSWEFRRIHRIPLYYVFRNIFNFVLFISLSSLLNFEFGSFRHFCWNINLFISDESFLICWSLFFFFLFKVEKFKKMAWIQTHHPSGKIQIFGRKLYLR